MNETILHCDLNGFYASVECLFRPELKNVPMAVSGNPENRHGIILAKNELAKKFGVATGETIWAAKRKCPEITLVRPSRGKYSEYSQKVNAIYSRFTNKIEPFGIDESWLDVAASAKLFGDPVSIADTIRKTVREELGLTVSIGVSFNKIFAKFGSDYKKPDATTLISRENYKEIIYPQPVSALLYVGRRTAEALGKLGIKTVGELARADKKILSARFGKHGELIYNAANGIGDADVAFFGDEPDAKSIGNSVTYRRDLSGMEDFEAAILDLSETVSARMLKEGVKCTTISVSIKNTRLNTITRQSRTDSPTNLSPEIFKTAMQIIKSEWDAGERVRMFGIACGGLIPADSSPDQMSIFDEENCARQKLKKMQEAVENVRAKFGRSSLRRANIAFCDIVSEADLPPSSLAKHNGVTKKRAQQ